MRVLFLGRDESPTLEYLREVEESVDVTADLLSARDLAADPPDFLVSHGYRHILRPEVLALFPDRAVNLHISYLPWNRGADPNLWSWIDETPKGVTIHYLDEGLDTGDVIAQRLVELGEDETLASSYAKLQAAMTALFREQWSLIREHSCDRRPQRGRGTFHRLADRVRIEHLLADGWETPVASLRPR